MSDPLVQFNPYQAPNHVLDSQNANALQIDAPKNGVRAEFFLAFCVIFSLAYTVLDELIFRTRFGMWPLLWVNSLIAIVVALVTADWKFSPLCCFASAMASDLLIGICRSWQYAQVPMAIAVSLLFSLPAFIIAFAISRGFLRFKQRIEPLDASKATGYR